MQFNQQLLEALMKKYGQAKALMPMVPGAGMTHALAKPMIDAIAPAIANGIGEDANTPAPGVNYGLPPQTPPVPPTVTQPAAPTAAIPAAPASLPPQPQSPPPIEAPAMPTQPAAPAMPQMSPEYGDEARKQLYAELAKKRADNAGWAAAGSFGDMAMRMGGNKPMDTQNTILKQGELADTNARTEFEAGKKGQLEDISTGLALKKAGREETEYTDQNNPNSQMSKLAVSLAQKYSPNEAKMNGWTPGKTSYADVIKVLPIMEKGIAMETAKSNREMTFGLKQQQDDENRLAKLGEAMSTEKMRSGSVGQMSQSLAGIGKLEALMSGYKGNLTPQEWQEAAVAWNRILTQGGVGGGEHSIQALVPHTLKGNIMGQIQWLVNNPTGTEQQEFSKRLRLGMDREKTYATGYVNKYKVGRLMDFQDVAARKASDVRLKLESQGIGFDDVAATSPDLAAKLWPQGSSAGTAPKTTKGGFTVIR